MGLSPLEREAWRPVLGFEGLYEVSDHGRVRSLARTVEAPGRRGVEVFTVRGVIMSPTPHHRSGHMQVSLSRAGRLYCRHVHRMVLEAFVGPRPEGMECRHFPDRDPANNRLSNLKWGTRKENHADKLVHGTSQRGEGCGMAKLTADQVREMRALRRAGGVTNVELGRRFGVDPKTVSGICTGRGWKWLKDDES